MQELENRMVIDSEWEFLERLKDKDDEFSGENESEDY